MGVPYGAEEHMRGGAEAAASCGFMAKAGKIGSGIMEKMIVYKWPLIFIAVILIVVILYLWYKKTPEDGGKSTDKKDGKSSMKSGGGGKRCAKTGDDAGEDVEEDVDDDGDDDGSEEDHTPPQPANHHPSGASNRAPSERPKFLAPGVIVGVAEPPQKPPSNVPAAVNIKSMYTAGKAAAQESSANMTMRNVTVKSEKEINELFGTPPKEAIAPSKRVKSVESSTPDTVDIFGDFEIAAQQPATEQCCVFGIGGIRCPNEAVSNGICKSHTESSE